MSDDKERAVNLAVENTLIAQHRGDPDDGRKMGSDAGGYGYDQNTIKDFLVGVAAELQKSKPVAYKFVYPSDPGFAQTCVSGTLFDAKFAIDQNTRVA